MDVHGTTRQKRDGAVGFREAFFGRLVRRSYLKDHVFYSRPDYRLRLVRARQRSIVNQDVRRQETTILRQYKHGS